MKKFRFRLEPLLRIKTHLEKEKQKILAAAAQKVYDQEQILDSINRNRLDNQKRQRNYLTGTLNKNLLTMFSRYYTKLKKDELTGRELLRAYVNTREEKRRDLVQATKEKKTFEKLKERQREKYDKELALALQKELDELAAQMYLYKKRLPV
jgi:flagellar FliJ protein